MCTDTYLKTSEEMKMPVLGVSVLAWYVAHFAQVSTVICCFGTSGIASVTLH